MRDADFEASGATETYLRRADSGNVITMKFCAHCHGWLWSEPPSPGIKVVRAGALDDLDWAPPVGNVWTDSKATWAQIDPDQVNFPKGAADRKSLFDAGAALTHKG
ncbi:MAG: GFA family protein [Candidatus Devosia euplotis]|nr:GFA family protein [Candidatus Devosia euplotis]